VCSRGPRTAEPVEKGPPQQQSAGSAFGAAYQWDTQRDQFEPRGSPLKLPHAWYWQRQHAQQLCGALQSRSCTSTRTVTVRYGTVGLIFENPCS